MRILVIEDDEAVRQMICRMLDNAGYDTLDAVDGKDGIRTVAGDPDIGLVITDIIMPEKEGIETIGELRSEHPHIKILAISGGGQGGAHTYLSLAERIGANATLKKPFVTEELLAVVRELVGAKDNPGKPTADPRW